MQVTKPLESGIFNLKLVDLTKPVNVRLDADVTHDQEAIVTYYASHTGFGGGINILDPDTGEPIHQEVDKPFSFHKTVDIAPYIQGRASIRFDIGAASVEANGTRSQVSQAATITYEEIAYTQDNVKTVIIPAAGVDESGRMPSFELDFTNWDGVTPVILKTHLSAYDGATLLIINGKQAADANTSGGSGELDVDMDISAYLTKGKNAFAFQAQAHHGQLGGGHTEVTISLNTVGDIPEPYDLSKPVTPVIEDLPPIEEIAPAQGSSSSIVPIANTPTLGLRVRQIAILFEQLAAELGA